MSKSYSNKALPAGTILREWKLEEVLGVGGFGIVYKGRGLYFDELVAIKEYFPSSISERKDGETVVPIDSDAEEVHSLGLKKFVEEAKLLWNLSTPERHPNIVSVRSLFEIHGTAYMVMDFEEGHSLSHLLRQKKRFDEDALKALIRPVAEGLERAHRVGVFHRDIKPPNILVGEDGRPVLIDFGSARFESGEATSTKVTFHTPPYAALEQYVKTFPQGPWTDIYALGVVAYECLTGTKPAEVLERLHGGDDARLVDGDWPGYSKAFLAAIDAAMAIKPKERPQSISEWLEMFDRPDDEDEPETEAEPPVEVTRVAAFEDLAAPKADAPAESAPKAQPEVPQPPEPAPPKAATKAIPDGPAPQKPKRGLLFGGLAAGALVLAGIGYAVLNSGSDKNADDTVLADQTAAAGSDVVIESPADLVREMRALLAGAREAEVPAPALRDLNAALDGLTARQQRFDAAPEGAARIGERDAIYASGKDAVAALAAALAGDVEARTTRLARDLPWADPRKAQALAGAGVDRQEVAGTLREAEQALVSGKEAAMSAPGPAEAISAARRALTAYQAWSAATVRARELGAGEEVAKVEMKAPVKETAPAPSGIPAEIFPAKLATFNAIVGPARSDAQKVIGMGGGAEPAADAPEAEKDKYRIRAANAKTAQGYLSYLDTLANSMRGERTEREVDQLIATARQTQRYLSVLVRRSNAAN